MQRHSADHGTRWRLHGGPGPRWAGLLALGGAVVAAIVLPLVMVSAGFLGGEGRATAGSAVRTLFAGDDGTDAKAPSAEPSRSPLRLGLATAARCGPELASPDGVEAQTCVLTQGEETWARTYYRNATGRALDAVLSLMGPDGRTVRMRCAVGADDEPGVCETSRESGRGEPAAYTAVAEFTWAGGEGQLLRSGSNSTANTGS